jgi:hypothetical protein
MNAIYFISLRSMFTHIRNLGGLTVEQVFANPPGQIGQAYVLSEQQIVERACARRNR